MLRRSICCFLAALCLYSIIPCRIFAVETSAASAILVDAGSGRVLYEHNADRKMLIASTTKIMTALVALALGADAVLIARPFVTAVYGGGEEGVRVTIEKYASELQDTMQMCGAHTLADITPEMVRR